MNDLLAKQHFYTDFRVSAFLEWKINFAVRIVSLEVRPKLEEDSDILLGIECSRLTNITNKSIIKHGILFDDKLQWHKLITITCKLHNNERRIQ